MSGGETANSVLKRTLEPFLKVPPIQRILEFQNQKTKAIKLVQKANLKRKIKPMNKNLQNELSELENKQTKGAKLHANIR